jgi:predicted dehydrogenase
MMEKVKAAIIGAGTYGGVHARVFNELRYVETTAICDINRKRAEALAEQYGIKSVYTDMDEMLRKCDCDFVSVTTPDHLHATAVLSAAKAKKNILVEKPFATKREDLFAMREAIAKNGVRAMCDLHNRVSPPFSNAKSIVDSGELGKVLSMYMRLNDDKTVATKMLSWTANSSVLWFLGSHTMDAISYFCGSRPKSVYSLSKKGVLQSMGIDTVDMYQTSLEMGNGCIAQMENGWVTPNGNTGIIDLKCTVLCDKGQININTSNSDMLQVFTEDRSRTPDCIARPIILDKITGFVNNSIRSFVDRLIDGKPFFVSVEEAVDSCIALLAVMESAEKKKVVEVDYQ